MLSIRLMSYYNYLGSFDFLDKELQTSSSLRFMPKFDTLKIQPKFDKKQLIKNTATKGLILEVFGNQKFFVKKTEKVFSESLVFELTLRKKSLFLFLENCLNTVFLYEHEFLNSKSIAIGSKLYFYLNSNIIRHFILTSNSFKFSIFFFILSEKNSNWSFYLIPERKSIVRRVA